ncbi:methionine ABC transporter substrate-binding protein [Vibrio toranzoniae]|uniref:MetQ/NlpA family ABC transporter substrate-binding protein n=1 Tax=Vibrio toranzoniae TaxID=1194427 RepID=UPI001377B477|nr:MetQ/NlpA family ABC transporter substrate-binding protein [Vibrio toranzoniae]NAZ52161.1 methionine ABC transporter substrate-binding protein [Vibrio toranzoniae]
MRSGKKITILLLALTFVLGVTGCEKKDESIIKIGATVGPHAQVVEAVAKEAEKQGINIEVVEFSDYITPNAALSDGSIDLNSYQHQPFLDNYNDNHNSNLVSIGRSILMRMGVYSNKYTALDALPENARIAIPNDPTNGGRGLLLLEDAGLISLKKDVGFSASLKDIVANPKNIIFVEVEAAQLPRTLDDVDAAAITMNYVMSSGLDPKKQGIYLEPKNAPLAVMVVAARNEDKNKKVFETILSIYHSQEINNFLDTTFKGTIEAAN